MNQPLTIAAIQAAYARGELTPRAFIRACHARAQADDHNAWISLVSAEQLEGWLAGLETQDPASLPLYGIPFAIKDNLDLAGLPTTAACPDFAYRAEESAFVVKRLMDAGAIPLGKTNLDQFATGLVGVRSPYGACRNPFDAEYISGGSSSGSAVAVACGQVCFALGTDTAGSGRVPAAFNNILGLKASKGLLSTSGLVPACRSLDCVTLLAHSAEDLERLLEVAAQFDAADPYARPNAISNGPGAWQPAAEGAFRFGVPRPQQLAFFGNDQAQALFTASIKRLQDLGGEAVEIDFAPFLEAARLLYEGPWVAERLAAIEAFFLADPQRCLPVIRTIIGGALGKMAVEAFQAQYRLMALKRQADTELARVDLVLTPTAGTQYRIDEVEADPIRLNANLGYYTNFMNLLDYCAVAVPAGFLDNGLPWGVTLFGPAFADRRLLSLAARWQQALALPLGATGQSLPGPGLLRRGDAAWVEIAVCGAHLSGLPLNHQLTSRGGVLVESTRTAPNYRFHALAGGPPLRPALVRDESRGAAIELEVWSLPLAELGSFVAGIPAPLGIGKLELADGRWVSGFICEPCGLADAREITALGSWRRYLVERAQDGELGHN